MLEEQDRGLWKRELIAEGVSLVEQAIDGGEVGGYTVQAAIAAQHALAPQAELTNWGQIVVLYDLLLAAGPSPIVELNRAVAVAMRDGADAGLLLIEDLLERGDLREYHLAHSARADMFRRLGRWDEAKGTYELALTLARQEPERRFLEKRLRELG